ncbi:BREX-1 system adenine-specific DNA-methyltransferase PglX [Butyrivibrio fibrisolvens]|uniref:BREX-1 system adenine-specific DNA-methyltransferase PglX n=1 Tax=Butyrivibrio fibrisolvens TaxID=831 RepID=UPI000427B7E5|nr:BREX-1 system adenine-specific DNA-methyltransferase PglX [Butyrivibrio fibrisolvens]
MDKNAIKKYAVWARTELITRVSQRAEKYDITAEADASASSVNGVLLSDAEIKQRKALIEQVKQKGFDQVMEEVAYTWFNRFIALRFMEVNGYLPSHIRVFTDDNNNFKPQILAEAIHLELDGLDMEKVYEMKNNNENDELYKYLIITQCNDLSKILPGMFQKISDYTELLFPDNILREGSIIEQMIAQIAEKDWNVTDGGQIEILGWLYQFYISEKHEAVVDPLHGKVVNKDEVPAATALFTTDWVVRYIIDNSVGRYWIERNPESNLKNELEYFVLPKNGNFPTVDEKITPEELTVLDPSMGSAHFGVYAFDVLMKIYMEYGVSERDAATSIVEKNLFGLDIDDRSAQIAYFAIMMKARQYDRRFLTRGVQPHFYSIQESNNVDKNAVDYFINGDAELKHDIESILHDFEDAKEYGSILRVNTVNTDALNARFDEIENDINMYKEAALCQIKPLVQVAELMLNQYAVVATNPPYLNKYDDKLKKYVNDYYKDYAGDLFSVFMYRNTYFSKVGGYTGFMTPFVWMFIKTYEPLRKFIIDQKHIETLIQFEYSAFEEATVPICSFVLKNAKSKEAGYYFRLSDFVGGMSVQKEKILQAQADKNCGYYFETHQDNFRKITLMPIAYWISEKGLSAFSKKKLSDYGKAQKGLDTCDVNRFVRYWYEVDYNKIGFGIKSNSETFSHKWFPYAKGGEYRKWYGNNYDVVMWENDGEILRNFRNEKGKLKSRPQNTDDYFKPLITWSAISSSKPSMRYANNTIYGGGGTAYIPTINIMYCLAYLNSKVALEYLKAISPTLNYEAGHIMSLPLIYEESFSDRIIQMAEKNIQLTKDDWDSSEISWDFKCSPLIRNHNSISEAYEAWRRETEERLSAIKTNEEEINKLFIQAYELDDELSPEVREDDINIRKADKKEDIKAFISYAVGCMFGRYSLDKDGIVYAGGDDPIPTNESFNVDTDGIIPICDDSYFEDDITDLFISFVKAAFGEELLEENLTFIADAIGNTGNVRNTIRNYFITEFYADHLKRYQKRPIYWLFDSGKKNGFKCLVYMHRYKTDTIARIRTNYIHELQARYRTAIDETERRIINASSGERVKATKELTKLKGQSEELHIYEEKIHHLADQMIALDLDDGVRSNYAKFEDVLAKIK